MWQCQTDPPCRMLDAKYPRCCRFAQSLQIPPCESEKPSEVKWLMSLNKITSSELRTLIAIVERKESLQEELAKIDSKLSAYLSPERPLQRRELVAARPNQVQPVSASLSKGKLLSQRSDKPNRSPRRSLVARGPVRDPER
jgi:hypothetical protein